MLKRTILIYDFFKIGDHFGKKNKKENWKVKMNRCFPHFPILSFGELGVLEVTLSNYEYKHTIIILHSKHNKLQNYRLKH